MNVWDKCLRTASYASTSNMYIFAYVYSRSTSLHAHGIASIKKSCFFAIFSCSHVMKWKWSASLLQFLLVFPYELWKSHKLKVTIKVRMWPLKRSEVKLSLLVFYSLLLWARRKESECASFIRAPVCTRITYILLLGVREQNMFT